MEKELEKTIEDLNFNIPKNDWEKLQQATETKNKLEEDIIDLIEKLDELESIDLD